MWFCVCVWMRGVMSNHHHPSQASEVVLVCGVCVCWMLSRKTHPSSCLPSVIAGSGCGFVCYHRVKTHKSFCLPFLGVGSGGLWGARQQTPAHSTKITSHNPIITFHQLQRNAIGGGGEGPHRVHPSYLINPAHPINPSHHI